MTACVNPTERQLVQLTLAADCRREAAYRRLALTILGLDVLSILADRHVTMGSAGIAASCATAPAVEPLSCSVTHSGDKPCRQLAGATR
jgi:hypothetical protein